MAAAGIGLLVAVVLLGATRGGPVLAPLGVGLARLHHPRRAHRRRARGCARAPCRCAPCWSGPRGLPRSAWGTALAHAGPRASRCSASRRPAGASSASSPSSRARRSISVPTRSSSPASRRGRARTTPRPWREAEVRRGGSVVATDRAGQALLPTRQQTVAEAGIVTLGLARSTSASATSTPTASIDARMFWKPLVSLIWFGALVMALGGAAVAVGPAPADRRRRPAAAGRHRPASGAARTGRMSARARLAAAVLLALCAAGPARAVEPDEILPDPRARSARPRASRRDCAASSARTSRSTIPPPRWRATCACIVRERLKAGDTDDAGPRLSGRVATATSCC